MDTEITEEIAADHHKIREVLENETPKWEPGRGNGYHAYTFGWIVDQIVRHADEKHRGIGQFLREEIAEPYGKHNTINRRAWTACWNNWLRDYSDAPPAGGCLYSTIA